MPPAKRERRPSVCFLLYSPDISGGTAVVFYHAAYAQRQGWDVLIVTDHDAGPDRVAWHPDGPSLTFKRFSEVKDVSFDLAIGTYWKTALRLHEVQAAHYIYFVQSIESRFCQSFEETLRDLIESTYGLNVHFVTEVEWIQDYLLEHFDTKAALVHNGVHKGIYRLQGPTISARPDDVLRVLVEGPLGVPMKNTERSIALANAAGADEVWLLTSSELKSYPGVDRVFSRIPSHLTGEVYRSCHVLVKLSYVEGMFGPPLEALLCGATVVAYKVTGHDLYLKHDENSILADFDDEYAVMKAIVRLREDCAFRQRLLANAAPSVADWPDWTTSSSRFIEALLNILNGPPKASRKALAGQCVLIETAYVTAERLRLEFMRSHGENPVVNPTSRYEYPQGRRTNELEAQVRELRAKLRTIEQQPSQMTAGTEQQSLLQLTSEVDRLREVIAAQEKIVLERWDAIQEMGRFIYERDQRIEELEGELKRLAPTAGHSPKGVNGVDTAPPPAAGP
jgi:glycosyltransferase involved in cell wall biosynthesis